MKLQFLGHQRKQGTIASRVAFPLSPVGKIKCWHLTFYASMLAGGGDGGGDIGEKAAKPATTVQACVSTFVRVTPLDIFTAIFASTNIFGKSPGHL